MIPSSCIAPGCGVAPAPGSLFCREHEAAPAGQRGGWLSAEKRRRVRANSVDTSLDASNIARRLWIGGAPPVDRHLPEFDVLVLCAQELQPAVVGFRGRILRCPLPDSELTRQHVRLALFSGRAVATALTAGNRVLVTCAMGRNRSALVAGLGLGLVTHLTSVQIVELVRARRHPNALSNAHFVGYLDRYIGAGRKRLATGKKR